jgi:4-amino-4-deoxy-L-arabinose transferase-like glycosyltransferase
VERSKTSMSVAWICGGGEALRRQKAAEIAPHARRSDTSGVRRCVRGIGIAGCIHTSIPSHDSATTGAVASLGCAGGEPPVTADTLLLAAQSVRARRVAVPLAAVAVLALAGALRLVDVDRAGMGNLFYASAARSSGESLRNFLFVAYDPAGTISVDKPPLGIWAQVLATKVLDFDGLALILPMALAGAVAVALVFAAARRSHGVPVALAAAAVLAVFPESVATARDSTMDALMMAMLAGAAWLLVVAVENRRGGLLLAWAALMGLVFNVKFFEGFVVLPAAALYLAVRWRGEWRARVRLLATTGAMLAAVSLSWVTFVELTPEDARPRILNDPSNSAYGLVLRYNGIERVLPGEVTIFAPVPGSPGSTASLEAAARRFGVGDAGPLRLFRGANGPLLGVTTLLALFGVAMAAWRRRDWLRGPGAFWAAWALTGLLLFSLSNRAAAHYTESYAPALAVMAAVGLVEGWRAREGWRGGILAVALAVVAGYGWWAVRDYAPLEPGTRAAALLTLAAAAIALAAARAPMRARWRNIAHGPHHVAQKSTTTGTSRDRAMTSSWNVASVASRTSVVIRPPAVVQVSRSASCLRLPPARTRSTRLSRRRCRMVLPRGLPARRGPADRRGRHAAGSVK